LLDLKEEVEKYVTNQLPDYKLLHIRAPKVIHDTVWGSNLFMPHEVALLDLPLVQRLRRISQVAVASLVYPSGNHNRFEHSLGVAVIGEQLVNALFQKIEEGQKKGLKPFTDVQVNKDFVLTHVRIAAIMHDCGHGPFSHLSEKIYEKFDDLLKVKKEDPALSKASAHEILSYLIVSSNSFKLFFEKNISHEYGVKVDLNLVAQMIVGYVKDQRFAFIVDIINGVFDADKLDYIQRDSHFTGIKMVLDLQRLFYTVDLVYDASEKLRLSVDISGVSTLEQIIFNKMMLFTTVYHHHKVRAAESIFKDLIMKLKSETIKLNGVSFSSTADFLHLTDDDIYTLAGHENKVIRYLATNLRNRRLPMRALVLSRKTTGTDPKSILKAVITLDRNGGLDILKKAISAAAKEKLGKDVPEEEIWIDLQPGPNFKEATLCPIKSMGEKQNFIKLHEVLPVDDWVQAFSQVKWSGYVFTRPEYRETVYEASKIVLEEAFDIKLNDFSRFLCKIDEEDISSNV